MNGIQGTNPAGRQWNRLLDAVFKTLKYKKSKIYYAIYIKVFTDGTVSYLTFYTDDVLNTTNNETAFPELTRVFEENFKLKVQDGSVLKYLNLRVWKYPLCFIVDQPDHIMELVNGWLPTRKFSTVDTPFSEYYRYEK